MTISAALGLASPALAATPADVPTVAPSTTASPRWEPFKLQAVEFGVGAAGAVVSVPGAMLLGEWVGTWSSNLYLAALPSLLLVGVIPPLVVIFVEWWAGNELSPGSARIIPTVFVTAGVHIASLVLGGFAGVWAGSAEALVLFTLIEAVLLPASTTASLYLFRPASPSEPVTTLDSFSSRICFACALHPF